VSDRTPFEWTADQLQRYAFLRETVAALASSHPIRLLDVGGAAPRRDGSWGWLPAREILRGGIMPAGGVFVLDRPVFQSPGYLRGDGLHLPFRDGAFDIVAAMDVLEHVPGPDRPAFLREIARTSADLVILSGPPRDEAVAWAERSVGNDIERRYHIRHAQLEEHAACGLISEDETRKTLASEMGAVTSLGFGSLERWISSLTLRNRYLLRRNTPFVLEKLDAYLCARDARPEFEPPFYRTFWLASKMRSFEDLVSLAGKVRARLLGGPLLPAEGREAGFHEFVAAAAEMESAGLVSAVVVSRGNSEALVRCLRHLLNQTVAFDFEIIVWDIGRTGGGTAEAARAFPAVRFLKADGSDRAANGLQRVASVLRGDAILLIDESVALPPSSVARLYAEMKADPGPGVWAWRVPWKGNFTLSWAGGQLSKAAAGRIPRGRRVSEILARSRAGWLFSRCLFFSRAALAARRPSGRGLGARSLFLWE
jgi:hypothetical protein